MVTAVWLMSRVAVRVTEVDRQTGVDAHLGVLSELGALVPGKRAAQLLGQARDRRGDRIPHRLGAVAGERRAAFHSLSAPYTLRLATHKAISSCIITASRTARADGATSRRLAA